MKKPVTGLLAVVFLACMPAISVGAATVGRTIGLADVSSTGQATYSITFSVPPGTNNMTPRLSLNYNHGAGEGLFGVGWSLSGLSGISRCNSTWIQDAVARDVRNDAQDRFCLDGQKLRLVSGTYGAAGSTYSTEIESFSRITANGVQGNGPASFTVETKEGLVYEYGATADSQILSVGQTTVRFWAVSRIRDRSSDTNGNAIVFAYTEDTTNGSFRPYTIQYASNTVQGVAAPYQVQFFYDNMPAGEIDSAYAGGALIERIVRATRMDVTHSSGTLVRRYNFAYEPALSSTAKSRLTSIEECAGSNPDCLAKTNFEYQSGTPGLGSEVLTSGSIPVGLLRPLPMDVNGDGKEDIVYSSTQSSGTGTWYLMFANSSGSYGAPINTGVVNTNYTSAITIDYNADGLDDLMVRYSGSTWWVMLGSAAGLSAPVNLGTPTTATGTGSNARAIDVNGDGLDDLVWADLVGWAGGDAIRYRTRELSGTFSSSVTNLVGPLPADSMITGGVFLPWGRPQQRRAPDFNGDGRFDVMYQLTQRYDTGDTGYIYFRSIGVACPGGTTFSAGVGGGSTYPMFMDLNGDGRSDLLYSGGTLQFRYRFSTGTSFTAEYFGPNLSGYSNPDWVIFDWDSDGREDVLLRHLSTNKLHVFRSTGEGWAAGVDTGINSANMLYTAVTDINGDGLPDIAYSNNGTWASRVHAGVYPDLLTRATDGFGIKAEYAYASLPTYSNYLKLATATFPQQESAKPFVVVSSLTQSDGLGGTFSFNNYYYEGARYDLQGRGFLGFSYRSWVDSRDGTAQRRSYRQDYPYIGMVTNARRTRQPDGLALEEVQTTYQTYNYGSGSQTRAFPYPSQTARLERQVGTGTVTLDGALLATATTTNLFDSSTGVLYDRETVFAQPSSGANGLPGDAGSTWTRKLTFPVADFQFRNDPGYWCLGRPGSVIAQNRRNSGSWTQRSASLTWDTAKCRRTREVIEPASDPVKVITDWAYDSFGNVSSTTVSGPTFATRTTSTSYFGSVNGQFPTLGNL